MPQMNVHLSYSSNSAPRGSKYPRGAVCPARPSAVMESLAAEKRVAVGLNATAVAARDAMMADLNIVDYG